MKKLMKNTHGIVYLITNLLTGKQYIGSTTKTLAQRATGHRTNEGTPFYEVGKDFMLIEPLRHIHKYEDLLEVEKYYIRLINPELNKIYKTDELPDFIEFEPTDRDLTYIELEEVS
jgi:predicted GIY-YIG superfamily endonuclease